MSGSKSTLFTAQIALLIAIQIILTVTPLGYIPIGIMEITIMHIPVLIGAIVLGPLAGGTLGFVFGLSSLFVALTRPTIGTWPFSPAMTGSFYSAVICILPRILLGILAGYVFQFFARFKFPQRLRAGIAAIIGSLCNTLLVLGGIYFLLGQRYADELGISLSALQISIVGIISTNGLVEAAAAAIVCASLVKPLKNFGAGM